jgi:hypothetical protein
MVGLAMQVGAQDPAARRPVPRIGDAAGGVPLGPGTFSWSGHDLVADSAGIAGRIVRLEAGLGPGPYRLEIGLIPKDGTADAILNDVVIASQFTPVREQSLARDFDLGGRDSRLELILKANAGQRVGVRSIAISQRDGDPVRQVRLSRSPAPDTTMSARDGVRACCDYLVRYQLSDGVYDDRDPAWVHAAYCVRALLAGYEILLDERYLDAARRTMSTFVGEQYPDGGWCAHARSRRQDAPCARRSIADLGVMVTCLPLISGFVEPQAVMVYLNAHGSFLDGTLTHFEGQAGAYEDFDPEDADRATATQAMAMTALFQATSDSTYLRRAESGTWALVFAWDRVLHAHGDPASLLPYLDAMCWVRRATADPVLQGRIDETLRESLYAEYGLLDRLDAATGWFVPGAGPLANGILGILVEARRILGDEPRIAKAIGAGTKALAEPRAREQHEVLVFPYEDSAATARAEAASAVLSTAMAGLSFAQSVAPGVVFRRR